MYGKLPILVLRHVCILERAMLELSLLLTFIIGTFPKQELKHKQNWGMFSVYIENVNCIIL